MMDDLPQKVMEFKGNDRYVRWSNHGGSGFEQWLSRTALVSPPWISYFVVLP